MERSISRIVSPKKLLVRFIHRNLDKASTSCSLVADLATLGRLLLDPKLTFSASLFDAFIVVGQLFMIGEFY